MKKKYLLQFGTVAGIVTILISLIGCAQNRALNRLERLVLDDDGYHSDAKSNVISSIESIDYERYHEEVVNIIFKGNLDLIDQFVEYFPDDYRNYIVRGDAYLRNSFMQKKIGILMKSSVTASVNTAKDSYMKALD